MPSGKVIWDRGKRFVGISGTNHGVVIDIPIEKGGSGSGPSNTELLMLALCGCTGMDVISILQKKRAAVSAFEVEAAAEPPSDLPKRLTRIDVVYRVWGEDVSAHALEDAIRLSKEKYCTVSNTLKGVAQINYRYEIYRRGVEELESRGAGEPGISGTVD